MLRRADGLPSQPQPLRHFHGVSRVLTCLPGHCRRPRCPARRLRNGSVSQQMPQLRCCGRAASHSRQHRFPQPVQQQRRPLQPPLARELKAPPQEHSPGRIRPIGRQHCQDPRRRCHAVRGRIPPAFGHHISRHANRRGRPHLTRRATEQCQPLRQARPAPGRHLPRDPVGGPAHGFLHVPAHALRSGRFLLRAAPGIGDAPANRCDLSLNARIRAKPGTPPSRGCRVITSAQRVIRRKQPGHGTGGGRRLLHRHPARQR